MWSPCSIDRPRQRDRAPDEATLIHWPFPTTSRHLGGSQPCINGLLNQWLNAEVVPEVGCCVCGISKAHAALSRETIQPIVSNHKCLFWFRTGAMDNEDQWERHTGCIHFGRSMQHQSNKRLVYHTGVLILNYYHNPALIGLISLSDCMISWALSGINTI